MNVIKTVDPQGTDAMSLLRAAAREASALYRDLYGEAATSPSNAPTGKRGTYSVGYENGVPVACGAIRRQDQFVAEVRRMYVLKEHRRKRWASRMLLALEEAASSFEYEFLRLETGNRQLPAISLYEASGFKRIQPYGKHANDPTSVCYEKQIARRAAA